ncbi:MAG TPA: cytochrome c [Bradyrhizobium sp.]|uniref:c-type cytochrome n=1 Tax=Bradyrhizobium sp. TaxID=376 RepID=UPI002B63CE53|nr:cytochrome c [Bradyrhizobium sp.]HLZ04343.1 cytochrome c [Bradyrhizobium sp.]
MFFRGFILGIIVAVVVGCGVIYFGLTNGAIPPNADAKPSPLERWAAGTSLQATLERDAPKGANPVAATDDNLKAGVQLYARHCTGCHGTAAGDSSATPIAKGENPKPPQLASEGVEDDPEGWTFWKIKHGIRWTGMPAWEQVLNDQQIWTLTLFLKRMDNLPPAAKAAWQAVQIGQTTSGPSQGADQGTQEPRKD